MCVHAMECKYVNVCLCVRVFAPIISPNDWQCPPISTSPSLLPFFPLLTLLSAACHWDFLMSSIAGLYLDGQSPPLMYLMAYLGYCIWQGGKLSLRLCECILVFLSLKGQNVLTGVERWGKSILLPTYGGQISGSLAVRFQRKVLPKNHSHTHSKKHWLGLYAYIYKVVESTEIAIKWSQTACIVVSKCFRGEKLESKSLVSSSVPPNILFLVLNMMMMYSHFYSEISKWQMLLF